MTTPVKASILYDFLNTRSGEPLTAEELVALDQFKEWSLRSVSVKLDRLHAAGKIQRSPTRPYSYWWDETCFVVPVIAIA